MEIIGATLDDVLIELYEALPKSTIRTRASRGHTTEMLGVSIRISKPRARLSRSENRGKPFSALGELLWYLAGSDQLEFIEPYVPRYRDEADDGIIHGAYGPRLRAMRGHLDQVDSVTSLLRKKRTSRRAVIQLFNAEDIASEYKEIPCTTTLQFLLREGALHLSANMRSNDAYKGLPHDVFCFTMLQEMLACRLNADLGDYYHYVGSMHLYDEDTAKAVQYLAEGYHKVVEMPKMPSGDPFRLVPSLLDAENYIRTGSEVFAAAVVADPYWADIIRMLQVFWASRRGEPLDELTAEFSHPFYRSYIEARRNIKRPTDNF